jgi:multisubunit Na+/H+ antiporter MnhB subunit
MSLRAFHMIFIVVSVALAVFVTVWGIRLYLQQHSTAGLGLAAVFAVAAVVMIIYGKKTFGKLRDLP